MARKRRRGRILTVNSDAPSILKQASLLEYVDAQQKVDTIKKVFQNSSEIKHQRGANCAIEECS